MSDNRYVLVEHSEAQQLAEFCKEAIRLGKLHVTPTIKSVLASISADKGSTPQQLIDYVKGT
jgi:hypothetical protein